jgi:hypothetical protein
MEQAPQCRADERVASTLIESAVKITVHVTGDAY